MPLPGMRGPDGAKLPGAREIGCTGGGGRATGNSAGSPGDAKVERVNCPAVGVELLCDAVGVGVDCDVVVWAGAAVGVGANSSAVVWAGDAAAGVGADCSAVV